MTALTDIAVNFNGTDSCEAIQRILDKATSVNVKRMIALGNDQTTSRHCMKVAADHANFYYTVGIHPENAHLFQDGAFLKDMREMYESDRKCVAIGECGLDYNRMTCSIAKQVFAFEKQVELAVQLNAPLFLHERDNDFRPRGSFKTFLDILDKHNVSGSKVCVHCFSSTNHEHLLEYVRRGYMIGISGLVGKMERGMHLQQFLRCGMVPLAQLFIETDSPWLAPDGWPIDTPNDPSSLPMILEIVSKMYDIESHRIAAQLEENFVNFFERS